MALYQTFFIDNHASPEEREALNLFIRSHRVLAVSKQVFPEGWSFCVEWIEGEKSAQAIKAFSREQFESYGAELLAAVTEIRAALVPGELKEQPGRDGVPSPSAAGGGTPALRSRGFETTSTDTSAQSRIGGIT